MIREFKLLSLVLFLSILAGGMFGLAQFAFAQSSSLTVTGTAFNANTGDIVCTLLWNGAEEIEGECTNTYFKKIIVDKSDVNVVAESGHYYIKGFGEIEPTFGALAVTIGQDTDSVFFSDHGDTITEITSVNGKYEIAGKWHNNVIGEMIFGAIGAPSVFDVVYAYPIDKAKDVALGQDIGIVFNQSVKKDTFESKIVITDDGNKIDNKDLSFNWGLNKDNKVVKISHSDFDSDSTVEILIPKGVKNHVGLGLKEKYEFSFETEEKKGNNVEIICGDGILDVNEMCDDGNNVKNDGCDDLCKVEYEWKCNGMPSMCMKTAPFEVNAIFPLNSSMNVALGQPIAAVFDDKVNMSTAKDISLTCIKKDNKGKIVKDEDGKNEIEKVVLNFPPELNKNGKVVRGKHADLKSGTEYTLTIPTSVKSYDGRSLDKEYKSLFMTAVGGKAPVISCGDGLMIFPEECDDRNMSNGDGCSSECKVENDWECSGEFPTQCFQKWPICGDGKVDNTYTGFGYHGYGYKGGGSVSKGEGCDDRNISNHDGCSSECKVETGFVCGGQPSVCLVKNLQGAVATPEIQFPTVFVKNGKLVGDKYEFALADYDLGGADWIKYDSVKKVFSIDKLPPNLLRGNYLFSIRKISSGKIYNAKIEVADVAKFLDPATGKTFWLEKILNSKAGEDVAGLGGDSKIEQVALLLSVFNALENLK